MEKLSRKELLWGLSHANERVYFPAFCYWMEKFLCGPCCMDLNAWQRDEELIETVSEEKICKIAPLALQEVLNTKPGINFFNVMTVRGALQHNDERGVNLMIAVLNNLDKFSWKDLTAHRQMRQKVLDYFGVFCFGTCRYDIAAAQAAFHPEFFTFLADHENVIGSHNFVKVARGLAESINIQLNRVKQSKDQIWRQHYLQEVIGPEIEWLNSVRLRNQELFCKLTCEMDKIKGYAPLAAMALTAVRSLNADFCDWETLLNYISSAKCPFDMSWKLEALSVIFNRHWNRFSDAVLIMRAMDRIPQHCERKDYSGYQKLLPAFIKRYPEDKRAVLLLIDVLVRREFEALHTYRELSLGDSDFVKCHWRELSESLAKLWQWSYTLPTTETLWGHQLDLMSLWGFNPEFGDWVSPLLKANLQQNWEIELDALRASWAVVRQIMDFNRSEILNEIRAFFTKILQTAVLPEDMLFEIRKNADFYGFFLEEALNEQEELRTAEAERVRLEQEAAAREEAEIEAFLAKLV